MPNSPKDVTFSSLDPSQKNTFDYIVNGEDHLHIVHGPPGTGKSQLVVSLLEGLAARGKKVLFVSQNTEALKVIERMIFKTQKDIGYSSDSKYLSLLDFCLMLYNSKHKQLKYLREQHSHLASKQLPAINVDQQPSEVDFILRYTNLDRNANYTVDGEVIGFDELVRYFIKYVNQAIAPEPLRELDSINVREVFKELDGYKDRERFSEYNFPKRELVLLSTKRTDITLPSVRQALRDIKEAIQGDWTQLFAAKEAIDVLDYLNCLKEYSTLVQYFDVYKLSVDNIDVKQLNESLAEIMDRSQELDRVIADLSKQYNDVAAKATVEVHGVNHSMGIIELSQNSREVAQEGVHIAVTDKDRMARITAELVAKYPNIQHASLHDLWVGMKSETRDVYRKAILDAETSISNKSVTNLQTVIDNLTKAELGALNADIEGFSEKIANMGSLKRMMTSVPDSIKKRFNITLVKDFEKFRDHLAPTLNALPQVMADSDTVGEALAVGHAGAVTLRKLNVSLPADIGDLATELAPVSELVRLLNRHAIAFGDFTQMKQSLVVLHKSLVTLAALENNPDNKKLFISLPIDQIIESSNFAIQAVGIQHETSNVEAQRRELWNEAYNSYSQILIGIDSTEGFEQRVIEIIDYLNHKSDQVPKALRVIDVPMQNFPLNISFESIERAIIEANNTDNFSDEFFELRTGNTISKWLDNIAVLETYNNDNEIIEYTRHNHSIGAIKNALGAANVKYIDSILSNDVSFETFAARIVNALVGEIFGRSSTRQRVHMTTPELLKAYEKYLRSERARSYIETLSSLHRKTMSATRELSKQSTLQAAGKSTMEKFRHNTVPITEAFPLVCATPKDIAKYVAPIKAVFDYVIFDEASQLLPGQALPSIYRAKKAVIIGDPHQMPPNLNASFSLVEQSEDDFDDLGESILDLVLKQPKREHRLRVHYRSRYNKLFEPSRQAIYSSDGVEPIFEAELSRGAPIDILDDLGDDIDEFGFDKNFAKVCESVEEYISQDENADFCVLFSRADVLRDFKNYMEEVGHRQFKRMSALYNQEDASKVLLSTVTNCQGIEGTYTVLYLHHYARPGAMWFFKEQAGAYKRLNVSITRQREGLKLLLADPRSHWLGACDQKISSESTGPNAELSAKLMKALLTNAGEQADESYLDRTLNANTLNFDSPLTEQLYLRLTEHYGDKIGRDIKIYSEVGWNLVIPRGDNIEDNERNVGFRIDLGIYSPGKKRFVLGIEMDGAMYHSGYEKEHSDYTRQKVLESKGWEMYRIWSTNWLMDIDREFSKLTHQIDKAISVDV